MALLPSFPRLTILSSFITPSPFHSRVKLKPSFSANPSHRSLPFLLPDWLYGFPGLFTATSEHVRFCFFSFPFLSLVPSGRLNVSFWAHVKIAQRIVSYRIVSETGARRCMRLSSLLQYTAGHTQTHDKRLWTSCVVQRVHLASSSSMTSRHGAPWLAGGRRPDAVIGQRAVFTERRGQWTRHAGTRRRLDTAVRAPLTTASSTISLCSGISDWRIIVHHRIIITPLLAS